MVTAREMPNARVEVAFDVATWRTRPTDGVDWTRVDRDRTTLGLDGTGDYATTPWVGSAPNGLYLSGASGVYASADDTANLDITGDLDVRCLFATPDMTPAATLTLVSKWQDILANQRSWILSVNTSGALVFSWSNDGTAALAATSTVTLPSVGVSDSDFVEVRATIDVDNGAAGRTVTFYYRAPGASSWTQLGAAVTTAGVTSLYNSTARVEVGIRSQGTTQPFVGTIKRATVLNGIGGTTAFDVDFTDTAQGWAVGDSNGATGWDAANHLVTITGAAALVRSVLDITPDIDIVVAATLADWTPAAPSMLVGKGIAGATSAWSLRVSTTGTLVFGWGNGAGFTAASTPLGYTDGTRHMVRVTHDGNDGAGNRVTRFYSTPDEGASWVLINTVTTAGTSTFTANTNAVGVGANPIGGSPVNGSIDYISVAASIDGDPLILLDLRYRGEDVGEPTVEDSAGRVYTLQGNASIDLLAAGCPLRHLTAERGARLKVAEVESGTATGTFDNRSRSLDPTNASSPWYPDVRPRRRIRYVLEPEGEAEVVAHTGFVERFPLAWEVGDHTVDITSTDLLALIGEEPLPESVHHLAVSDLGAILHWPMADDSGSVMEDVIGQRDGAYRLGAEGNIDVVPYAKGGARFAGYSSGNRKVPQATLAAGLLDLTTSFSISLWFQAEVNYPDGIAGSIYNYNLFQQDPFFDGFGSASPYLAVLVISEGEFRGVPRFYIGDGGTSDFRDFLPDGGYMDLLDGLPHHILAVCDGAGAGEALSMYVDGIPLTQGSTVLDVGSWPSNPTGASTLIGNNSNVEWASFDAASQVETAWKVAHVSVYEEALTAADAVTLYESGAVAWRGDRTGERLGRVLDAVGVDAGDRSIATGTQVCGPTFLGGTLAEYVAMLVSTEQGSCYVDGDGRITFTERPENDPTPLLTFAGTSDDGIPYADVEPDYSLDRIVNDATVTREGGLPQRSTNATSVDEWGTVPVDFTTGHLSASGARATGARITIRNGEPRLVFGGLDLAMRRLDVPASDVLALILGDAVTVIANPTPDGTPISQLSLVERIAIELDWHTEKDWRVALGVTEHTVLPSLAWDTPGAGWNESVWDG